MGEKKKSLKIKEKEEAEALEKTWMLISGELPSVRTREFKGLPFSLLSILKLCPFALIYYGKPFSLDL